MNIDTQMLYQMLDQIHDQMRDQMSQILTYFTMLSILQVVIMSVLVYLLIKGNRENRKDFYVILKQSMDIEKKIQQEHSIQQKIDYKLDNFLKNTNTKSNSKFNAMTSYYPEVHTNQAVEKLESFDDSPSENSPLPDDPKLEELIKAYNQGKGSDLFISLTTVIDNLINNGIVNSEDEAKKMINTLTRMYPSAIMIENVRGQKFPQIAIIN